MAETLLSIGIDELMADPTQPRKSFLKDEIERLSKSVATRGVLCPLRVRRDDQRQAWRIIVGESRWRAARLAGLTTLPCIVVEGDVSETDILSDQIIENTVRNSLRPLELARSLVKLKALKKTNSHQLAAELGLSGASICRAESLLSLPADLQTLVDAGRIPESTAYEISRLPDEASMRELAAAVMAGRLGRDEAALAVRGQIGQRKERPKVGRLAARIADLGLCVTVTASGREVTADDVRKVIEQLRRLEKKLSDAKDLAAV